MKMLILAAGYATRLYPLTKDFPKPLLEVKGRTIVDHMLDVMDAERLEQIIVVTNHRFVSHFCTWREKSRLKDKIVVLDDGSTDNENRLGAVRDIAYAIEELKLVSDLLVVAGDNLLDFSLDALVQYFYEKDCSVVMRYFEADKSRLQRTGVAEMGEDDKIIGMEEKPSEPKANWAIPPFYIFRAEDLELFKLGLLAGCAYDAPGDYLSWLCKQTDVYAMKMPGSRYDIGTMDSYEKIR